jgi:hypothetical protein
MRSKNIQWNVNQHYGGFLTYWQLYAKFVKQVGNKSAMTQAIMQQVQEAERVTGQELTKKTERALFLLRLKTYTVMFPWACLIKPLGQFFSKRTSISGSYSIHNDQIANSQLNKQTTYKLFKIPVWQANNQRLTEQEIQELLK